jgi:hypothetical protein
MLEMLKRARTMPVTAASLREALREVEAKLPEARDALASAQRERADLLLRGSEKEIIAAEAQITSARIAIDRYEAAQGELARKVEEAEVSEAAAALDAEHRAVEARAAALAKRIVAEYAEHAGPLSALMQEGKDMDAAIDALNAKLLAAGRGVLVQHVEERAIPTGPFGVIRNALRDNTSLLPIGDGAGWGWGCDYARRNDFKV